MNPNGPPKEYQFKKGQSGNPKGVSKTTDKLKEIKMLTQIQVEEIGSLILNANKDKLIEIKNDPNTPVLKLWMSTVAIKGIATGDMQTLNGLLDRLIGRIPVRLEAEMIALAPIIERIKQLKDLPKTELLRIAEAKLVEAKEEEPKKDG